MSNREKTGLLDKEDPHISRARQCELLELKRSSSYYVPKNKWETLIEEIHIARVTRELQEGDPRLGLRRCIPLLREIYGIETTHDRLRRIMQKAAERAKKKAEAIKKSEEERLRRIKELEAEIGGPDDDDQYNRTYELLMDTEQKPLPCKFESGN